MERSERTDTPADDAGSTSSSGPDAVLQNTTKQRQQLARYIADSHQGIRDIQSKQPAVEEQFRQLEARLNPQPQHTQPKEHTPEQQRSFNPNQTAEQASIQEPDDDLGR